MKNCPNRQKLNSIKQYPNSDEDVKVLAMQWIKWDPSIFATL